MTQRKARHWCYTLNNYTEAEEMFLREVSSKYHVYGKEVSDSGTPHLQGYIIFDQSLRFNKVKEVLGATRIHLEVKKGVRSKLQITARRATRPLFSRAC